MIEKIQTSQAPAAIGPYSQAVRAGGLLFVSGQIPVDPQTGAVVAGGIEAQTHRVFRNLQAILQEAGTDFDAAVKTTVFLKDMADFQTVNEIYAQYITGTVLPARSAVQAARLPKDILIEMELIAAPAEQARH